MSKEAPENAQGELQGGIASLQNVAMLIGTFFYAQAFGWFMAPNPVMVSPSVGYFICAALMVAVLAYFMSLGRSKPITRR